MEKCEEKKNVPAVQKELNIFLLSDYVSKTSQPSSDTVQKIQQCLNSEDPTISVGNEIAIPTANKQGRKKKEEKEEGNFFHYFFILFLVTTNVRENLMYIIEQCYKFNAGGKVPVTLSPTLVNYDFVTNSPPLDTLVPNLADSGNFIYLVHLIFVRDNTFILHRPFKLRCNS